MQKHPKEVAIGSSSNHLRRCCLLVMTQLPLSPFSLVTIRIVRFSLSCLSTELHLSLRALQSDPSIGYVLLTLLVAFSDLSSFSLSESSAHNPSLLQCHRLSCSVFPVIPLLLPPQSLIHPPNFPAFHVSYPSILISVSVS